MMQSKIELYSGKNCPKCSEVKQFFKSNNIEFVEYDIWVDEEAMGKLMEYKLKAIPQVFSDGVPFCNGLDYKEKFKESGVV